MARPEPLDVTAERHLDWEGCFNARDLGGLPVVGGGSTRWGAVVRADTLDELTAAGWQALVDHGIRTVIDLRNPDERRADAPPPPPGVDLIRLPLDGSDDREFWDVWDSGPQFGTPLYYLPHLERHADRSIVVLQAIARARPGGVAFHCGGGRDRAGQVTMLLLALVGVPADVIAADYALSFERLPARYAARGEADQGPMLREYLAERGQTAEELIVELVEHHGLERRLLDAGLRPSEVEQLRARLLADRPATAREDDGASAAADEPPEELVALWTDEHVMRYLGGARPLEVARASAAAFLASGGQIIQHDGAVVGGCALRWTPDASTTTDVELELVVLLHPAAQRRGLATRAARQLLDRRDGPVVAVAQAANDRSRRLLERLGFREAARFERFDVLQVRYVLDD